MRRRFEVALLNPPAASSVASAEQADKLRGYAYDQAASAIVAALDHLDTWWSLLQGARYMPTYAHMTLLRTVHESALFAYWLTEPGIDPDVRRGRGVAAHAKDYDERRKFEESRGITSFTPPGKLAKDRLADLTAMADKVGLVKLDRKGHQVLTVAVPATVDLFDLYEPAIAGEGARPQSHYRLCSGYAHAKQWALALGAERLTAHDETGRALARVEGIDDIAIFATRRAGAATDRAISAYEGLLR
jgi:hypothetical protein